MVPSRILLLLLAGLGPLVAATVGGDQPVALYAFDEANGTVVRDTSGVGPPLDLVIADPGRVLWGDGLLSMTGKTTIASPGPATKIIDGVMASGEVAIELWLRHGQPWNQGPARILTLGANGGQHDLALDVVKRAYEARFRSTGTKKNGKPETVSPKVVELGLLQHVLYTREASGATALWLDGQQIASGQATGSADNWDTAFRLGLANEILGNRHWRGELLLAAIFTEALDADDIERHHRAGPDGDLPPSLAITAPANGSRSLHREAIALVATAHDSEDGDISAAIEWHSSRDGIIANGGTPIVDHLTVGTHTLTATVSDSRGQSTSASITVVVEPNLPPTVAITAPADGHSVLETDPIAFAGTAIDPEDGNLANTAVWTSSLDGEIATGASFSTNALSIGSHVITLAATDRLGLTASTSITVVVEPNLPPTVAITAPADGHSVLETDPVAFAGTATDPEDGNLANAAVWTSSLDGDLATGASFTTNALSIGTHVITLAATDRLGLTASTSITVVVEPNLPPTVAITAPADLSRFFAHDSIAFSGQAVDPEDGDLTAGAVWTSSLDGQLALGGAFTTTALSIGDHVISLSASDRLGLTGSATIALTIEPATIFARLDAVLRDETGALVALWGYESQANRTVDVAPGSEAGERNRLLVDGTAATDPAGVQVRQFEPGVAAPVAATTAAATASWQVDRDPALATLDGPRRPARFELGAPACLLTTPGSGLGFPAAGGIHCTAALRYVDPAWVRRVEFLVDGTVVASDDTHPYAATWLPPGPGPVEIHARAVLETQILASTAATITVRADAGGPASELPADGPLALSVIGASDNHDGTRTVFFTAANGGTGTVSLPLGNTLAVAPAGLATVPAVAFPPGQVWHWPQAAFSLALPADDALLLTHHGFAHPADDTTPPPPALEPAPVRSEILAPAAGAVIAADTTIDVRISAAAYAPTVDDLAQVALLLDGLEVATGPGPRLATALTGLEPGTHVLQSRATSQAGRIAFSPQVPVLIGRRPEVAITAPASGLVAPIGSQVTVMVAASDIDGSVERVEIHDGGVLVGQRLGPGPVSVGVVAGSRQLRARALDNHGLDGWSDTVVVAGNRAPVVTLTDPRPGLVDSSTLTLAAVAADPDGRVTAVEFLVDGALVASRTAPPWLATTPIEPGQSRTCQAAAVDNHGQRSLSTAVTVTRSAIGDITLTAPAAGSLLPVHDPVTLRATTTLEGVSAVTFAADGNTIGTIASPPYTFVWLPETPGAINLTVSALAAGENHVSSPVPVTVNGPPAVAILEPTDGAVASASQPVAVTLGLEDQPGDLVSTELLVDETPTLALTGSATSIAWQHPGPGTYRLRARATDRHGAVGWSESVTVRLNRAPGIQILTPERGTVAAEADVLVRAHAVDVDGQVASVAFRTDGEEAAVLTTPPYDYTWTSLERGPHQLVVVATDNDGETTTSEPVLLLANQAPSVSLLAPSAPQLLVDYQPLTASATAADVDGHIVAVTFMFENDDETLTLASDPSPPYAVTVSPPSGTWNLLAVAEDDRGFRTSSAPISVTVDEPPVITAFTAIPVEGPAIRLQATVVDPEGALAGVELRHADQLLVDQTSGVLDLTTAVLEARSHRFELIATDAAGGTTRAVRTVTLDLPPRVELVAPLSGATVAYGGTVTLRALAQDDDGAIAGVAFFAGQDEIGRRSLAPYEMQWRGPPRGTHHLRAVAFDDAGNPAVSQIVTLTVGEGPVRILTPADGTRFATGTATTAVTVAVTGSPLALDLLVDGQQVATTATAPWAFIADLPSLGTQRLVARSRFADGTTAESPPVDIGMIDVPRVSLTAPLPAQILHQGVTVPIAARALAENPLAHLAIAVDGVAVAGGEPDADGALAGFWWPTAAGTAALTATAWTADGIAGHSQPLIVTVNARPQLELTPVSEPGADGPPDWFLEATASDSDGQVVAISVTVDGHSLGRIEGHQGRLAFHPRPGATHRIVGLAEDDRGGMSDPAIYEFSETVQPGLTILAPADGSEVVAGVAVPVDLVLQAAGEVSTIVVHHDSPTGSHQHQVTPGQGITLGDIEAGSHTLTATAVDPVAGELVSVPVAFTARAEPLPTIALVSPAAGSVSRIGSPLQVEAAVTGPVEWVRFTVDDQPVAEITAPPFITSLELPWGDYRLGATAIDSFGRAVESAPVTYRVNAPPRIGLGLSGLPALGAGLELTATVTDPERAIAAVAFRADDQEFARLTAPPFVVTYTPTALGPVAFTAVVTDDAGATATAGPVSVDIGDHLALVFTAPTALPQLRVPTTVSVALAGGDPAWLPAIDAVVFSVEDPDGSTTTLGTRSQAPWATTWVSVAPGEHRLLATATLADGRQLVAEQPLAIADNGSGGTFGLALLTPVSGANVTDADLLGVTARVLGEIEADSVTVAIDGGPPIALTRSATTSVYSSTVGPLPAGSHTAVAHAVSGQNQVETEPVPFTVRAYADTGLAITSPATGTRVAAGSISLPVTVELTAGHQDITAVRLAVGALGHLVEAAQPGQTTYTFTLPPLPPGTYNLLAEARSPSGTIASSATVVLTASEHSPLTLIAPTLDTRAVVGRPLALAALLGGDQEPLDGVDFLINDTVVATSSTRPWATTWMPSTPGLATIQARAETALGPLASARLTLDILPASGIAIVSPDSDTTLTVGDPLAIELAVAGEPAQVQIFWGPTELPLPAAPPWQLSVDTSEPYWAPLQALATYTTEAGSRFQELSAPVMVRVEPPNRPPLVVLQTPGSGDSLVLGDPLVLRADAVDGDGRVVAVRFLADGQEIATSATAPWQATWLPTTEGPHAIQAEAIDDNSATTTTQPVSITVEPPNQLPEVELAAPDSGQNIPANEVLFAATATDNDGRVVKVSFLLDGRETAILDSDPWQFSPAYVDPGDHVLTATAVDNDGGRTTSATVAFTVTAPELDPLEVILVSPLDGARSPPGHPVALEALVGNALLEASVTFLVDGIARAEALEPDVDGRYRASFTPTATGAYLIGAEAVDYGRSATAAEHRLFVAPANAADRLTVAFTDPLPPSTYHALDEGELVRIGGYRTITGTVTSADPGASVERWELAVIDGGGNNNSATWQVLADGQGPITADTLGAFDGTLRRNGLYTLRLTGWDTLGRSRQAVLPVLLEGEAKVGHLSFTETDLVLPAGGFPITVSRTYNSLNGDIDGPDFGHGWTASWDLDIDFNESRSPALDFLENEHFSKRDYGHRDVTVPVERWATTPGPWSYRTVTLQGAARDISLTLPDGRRTTYRSFFRPRWTANQALSYNVRWLNADGVTTALEPRWSDPANTADFKNSDLLLNLAGFFVFDAAGPYTYEDNFDTLGFDLVEEDGTRYRVERDDEGGHFILPSTAAGWFVHAYTKPRVTRITAPDGSSQTIDDTGLKSWQADGTLLAEVLFRRDGQGRMLGIRDPGQLALGRDIDSVRYGYDGRGNLVRVERLAEVPEDASGNLDGSPVYETTHYRYENPARPHFITAIVAPDGRVPMRVEYDEDGRVVATIDSDGNRVELEHDVANRLERVTDRNGHTTTMAYDRRGNVVFRQDPLGHVSRYAYDRRDNLVREEDTLGNVTTHTYDGSGNRLSTTDALGHTTRWAYNSRGQVLSETDALGRITRYTYDGQGNQTTITDAAGNVTRMEYDANGFLVREIDALGHVTTYGYGPGGFLIRVTDALGHISSYKYDANGRLERTSTSRTDERGVRVSVVTDTDYDAQGRPYRIIDALRHRTHLGYSLTGQVTAVTDAAGRVTRNRYDGQDRLVATTAADGTTTGFTYDPEGNLLTQTDAAGRITRFEYDPAGRRTATVFPDGTRSTTVYDPVGRVTAVTDAAGRTTRYVYDALGRTIRVIAPADTDAGEIPAETTYQYDAVGNQVAVTDAQGRTTRTTYDVLNRPVTVTLADGSTTHTTYDALSRRTAETDQAGRTTRYEYDPLGRHTAVIDALGQHTVYGYDELGNQILQRDANGRETRYVYDNLGRRIARILPLGQREELTYSAVGNLLTRTDFNGRTTRYAYDQRNRLTTVTPDPVFNDPGLSFTYTATGRRRTMTDRHGPTVWSYDEADRLVAKVTPFGSIGYDWHTGGQLARISSLEAGPGAANLRYSYDGSGRMLAVRTALPGHSGDAATQQTTRYAYTPAGALAQVELPNGTVTSYTYDHLHRLTELRATRTTAGTIVDAYHARYTLDVTGKRTEVRELHGRRVGYTYDDLDRLTGETLDDLLYGLQGQTDYTYDAVGNRLTRTSTLAPLPDQAFTYDANDRLTTDHRTWDDNGNLLTDSDGNTYTWDWADRLTQVTQPNGTRIRYAYDGDGNRISRQEIAPGASPETAPLTTYLIDTLNPTGYAQVLEEYVDGGLKKSYVLGLDVVARHNVAEGSTTYFGYDGHGSVRFLTDQDGDIQGLAHYDAFGVELVANGFGGTALRYAGEARDSATGLDYLRARFLDPTVGRFHTMDTWEGRRADPMSLHKYLYCHADPVNLIDPTGHMSLGEIMQVITIRASYTAARFAAPVSAAVGVGYRLMRSGFIRMLQPLFRMVGRLPSGNAMRISGPGQPLTKFDKLMRFFMQTTRGRTGYPKVASWLKRLFPRIRWQQHHVGIQQRWFRPGSASQWYPNDSLANYGLQRLGNAGFNLLAIPARLNGFLGRTKIGTVGFAGLTYGTVAYATYQIYDYISSALSDDDLGDD